MVWAMEWPFVRSTHLFWEKSCKWKDRWQELLNCTKLELIKTKISSARQARIEPELTRMANGSSMEENSTAHAWLIEHCKERVVRIQLCKIDISRGPVVWIHRQISWITSPVLCRINPPVIAPFPFPFSVNGPGTPDGIPLNFKCYSWSSVKSDHSTNYCSVSREKHVFIMKAFQTQSGNFHLEKYSSVRKIASSHTIQPNVNVHKVLAC